jgi:pilus assembly protein CpaF
MIRTPTPDEKSVKSFALRFQKLKADIHRQLVEGLDLTRLNRINPDRLRREVREIAVNMSRSSPEMLNELERERLVDEIMHEAFGLGPLEGPMNDPTISDILVNGPREVYLERNGRLELSDILFADESHLMQVIQRIAARVGRRIDEMCPLVDARLADGSRVNAIIPPLSLNGPVLSIRRFGVRLNANDLLAYGTVSREMLHLLGAVVQGRLSVIISGGTGAGKTTFLNILSSNIPRDERLVTIEDTAELRLQQPHVVKLETRPANLEGIGEVKQRDLVRNALRMRPDRIILGECRGPEALDMLQAMNTGHEGSLTTVHANDTRDALSRLEMMVKLAGFELPLKIIRQYISSAIVVLVHLARLKGGQRRVLRVSELVGLQRGSYVLRDIYGYRQLGVKDGAAYGEFYSTGYEPAFVSKLKSMGIELPASIFQEQILA